MNPNYVLDFGSGGALTNLVASTYTSALTLSGTASIDSSASAATYSTGGITASTAGTKTLNLTGSNTGANLISSAIGDGSGAIAITKGGAGTWTLSGTGTITGSATISGIHNPGNSPGIQTFGDDLTYSGGLSIVNLEVNSYSNTNPANPNAIFDQMLVAGDLNFAATTTTNLVFSGTGSTVDWSDALWNDSQSWLVYDVTGAVSGFDNLDLNVIDWLDKDLNPFLAERPDSSFSFSNGVDGIYLNYTVVPEPSTALLGGLGILALLRRRRK